MSASRGEASIWAGAEGGGGASHRACPGAFLSVLQAGLSEGSLLPHVGQGHGLAQSLARGSPRSPRKEQVTCGPGWRVTRRWLLTSHTPSPLHHRVSTIPLHLLPKYHRGPVIVNIQRLTQT